MTSIYPGLKGEALLTFVLQNIDLHRDDIIEKSGYFDDNKGLLFSQFYIGLLVGSLGFPEDRFDDWDVCSEYFHKCGGGSSPILRDGLIVGRYEIRISDVARDYDWKTTD